MLKIKRSFYVVLSFLVFITSAGSAQAGSEGSNDTFYGVNAGFLNSGANSNAFFGAYAGEGSTSGKFNTLIGHLAGNFNGNGSYNTFIGKAAGINNYNSQANTFVGADAGLNNFTGDGNVFVGFQAGYSESGSNKLYIENSGSSTPLIYGEFDNDIVDINGDLYVYGNMYAMSDGRYKKDILPIESSLEKIMKVRGVSYTWKERQHRDRNLSFGKHYGVIAQEVEKILPVIVNEGKNGERSVAYIELIPVLIEAIKEQQKTISELSGKVMMLESQLKLNSNLEAALIIEN